MDEALNIVSNNNKLIKAKIQQVLDLSSNVIKQIKNTELR